MMILEEIARELDGDAPGILYRQDLAAILRKMAAEHRALADLERDAKRYRWLRDDGDGPANAIAAAVAEGDNEHGGEYVSWLYGDELDAAIDAAMRE